ncbi:MAG: hypothetical protein H0T46_17475 [Deltaproteobacteria bacterium]|nr:hypothetical protein [Deltaproteobacteria bacterium]
MTTEPQLVRRRSALGVSGWLLFVCLFLPTLRVCGDPMLPVQFPPTYGVYLGGLLVGILGFATLHRTRRGLFVGLSALYMASVFTFLALFMGGEISEAVGMVAGVILTGTLIIAVRKMSASSWSERAISIGCVVHATVSLGWSSLLAFDPEGLWGAMVAVGASSLMLFAAIGYAIGAAADARRATEPVPLPTARVV